MNAIDDSVLADFMAGRLTPEERAEVIRYLSLHEDAREWLRMSYHALEAAYQPTEARVHALPADREALPRPSAARPRIFALTGVRLAAAIALLVVVGVVLRVAMPPPHDQLRGDTEQVSTLDVRVAASAQAIEWHAVPEASQYEVIVWDETAARAVASERVAHPRLSATPAFLAHLHRVLQPAHRYTVRVAAYDEENRHLVSSDLTRFEYGD